MKRKRLFFARKKGAIHKWMKRKNGDFDRRKLINHNTPTPFFFVSVASKRLRFPVSSLFSTLTGEFTSVECKGLTGATCLQESNWVGPDDFGGVRRTTPREGIDGRARGNRPHATKELYHTGTYCQVITV